MTVIDTPAREAGRDFIRDIIQADIDARRHASVVTYATCGLHCASCALLYTALPPEQRQPAALVLMVVILGWVTWASDAMALLLKRIGDYLDQPTGIADIEKGDAAVVPSLLHPTGHGHIGVDVGLRDFARAVRPQLLNQCETSSRGNSARSLSV